MIKYRWKRTTRHVLHYISFCKRYRQIGLLENCVYCSSSGCGFSYYFFTHGFIIRNCSLFVTQVRMLWCSKSFSWSMPMDGIPHIPRFRCLRVLYLFRFWICYNAATFCNTLYQIFDVVLFAFTQAIMKFANIFIYRSKWPVGRDRYTTYLYL